MTLPNKNVRFIEHLLEEGVIAEVFVLSAI